MTFEHVELHALLVGLIVGTQVILTGLAVLNLRHSDRAVRKRSEWLQESMGIDDPERTLDYLRINTGKSQLESWLTLSILLLVVYSGLYTQVLEAVASTDVPAIAAGVGVFVGAVVFFQLLSVPFDLFGTFGIEEIFDFNEQSLGIWLKDTFIMLMVSLVIVSVVGAGLLFFVDMLGQLWWLAGTALVGIVMLGMMVVLPEVIMPLMYDFEPIDEGELRESVESVFEKAGFSCEGIYEMEMSSHTSKSNAMFMGFGPAKRVALGDTLIESHSLAEMESVLAHELAHYKRNHVWKRIGATVLQYAVTFGLLALLVETSWLYEMFGLPQEAWAGLLTGMLWLWPLQLLTTPLNNRLSIRHEYEADAFAAETTGNPEAEVSSLSKLADENLANPFPHPWYEAFHYDHPPIPKRIEAVQDREADSTTAEAESSPA